MAQYTLRNLRLGGVGFQAGADNAIKMGGTGTSELESFKALSAEKQALLGSDVVALTDDHIAMLKDDPSFAPMVQTGQVQIEDSNGKKVPLETFLGAPAPKLKRSSAENIPEALDDAAKAGDGSKFPDFNKLTKR